VFTTAGVPSPCPRRRSHLNTDAKIEPEALVNQSGTTDQSAAPRKKPAVGAAPKAARAAKSTKAPRRPPRSSRTPSSTEKLVCRYCGRGPVRRSWSADIAAAMTLRRPSKYDAMPDAAPASRSATARSHQIRRPRALGRRKPPSSFGRRSKSDRGLGSSRGSAPIAGW
jgi:hypothetical protein